MSRAGWEADRTRKLETEHRQGEIRDVFKAHPDLKAQVKEVADRLLTSNDNCGIHNPGS